MDNLEKFIRENRGDFDTCVPSLDVWANLDQHLDRQRPSGRVVWMKRLRVAAAVLVLLTAGGAAGVYLTNAGKTVESLADVSPEHAEMERYFSEQVEEKLDALNLDYVLLDSVDYKKDFPKHSVVEQDPVAGSKVKEDRKIYIKINSSGFTTVRIPNLIEKTYRQALPTLNAIGLQEGEITYVPYLGKDMVLKMMMNGLELRAGAKILKDSKIDLVLGDGKVVFDEKELDTIVKDEVPVDSIKYWIKILILN